jgi:hypothetical protein
MSLPRLASVIGKDFSALHDDARSQVDCFVSLTHLAFLIAISSLVGAVVDLFLFSSPLSESTFLHQLKFSGVEGLRHLVFFGGALIVSILSYWRACVNAMAWGNIVKSAFDCYLPALMKQLGYEIPPRAKDRQKFWMEYSTLIAYQIPMKTDWPVASTTTTAEKKETGAGDERLKTDEDSAMTKQDNEQGAVSEDEELESISNTDINVIAAK